MRRIWKWLLWVWLVVSCEESTKPTNQPVIHPHGLRAISGKLISAQIIDGEMIVRGSPRAINDERGNGVGGVVVHAYRVATSIILKAKDKPISLSNAVVVPPIISGPQGGFLIRQKITDPKEINTGLVVTLSSSKGRIPVMAKITAAALLSEKNETLLNLFEGNKIEPPEFCSVTAFSGTPLVCATTLNLTPGKVSFLPNRTKNDIQVTASDFEPTLGADGYLTDGKLDIFWRLDIPTMFNDDKQGLAVAIKMKSLASGKKVFFRVEDFMDGIELSVLDGKLLRVVWVSGNAETGPPAFIPSKEVSDEGVVVLIYYQNQSGTDRIALYFDGNKLGSGSLPIPAGLGQSKVSFSYVLDLKGSSTKSSQGLVGFKFDASSTVDEDKIAQSLRILLNSLLP